MSNKELKEKAEDFEFTNGTYGFNAAIKHVEISVTKPAIEKLKNLLAWSDRLGSDEIYEINKIIELLNLNK